MTLNFQFESMQDFWNMAGHGPYVWVAYLIFFSVIALLYIQLKMRKKQVLNKVRTMKRHAQAQTSSS